MRLGWPLYVTPGKYKVRVAVGEASATTELEVKAPKAREPRMKKEPKIRGQKADDE